MPTGGAYTAGAGTIKSSGNAVTINQSTLRGIIDWNSFSLSQGSSITFKNGAGATLNLVNNGPMSSILGSLSASGSVYLINPAGVLIGASGRVSTGGDFLASTLKVSPQAFMQGGALDFSGPSKAAVVNLGNLYSNGGSVFLIGHQVSNGGSIAAANGTAGLAAGSEVLLKDSTGDQRIFVKGSGGDISNSGTIAAAQAELRSKGGNIYAMAGNNSSIAANGTATIDGKVWLVSDGGTTVVNGAVSAQNSSGTGGDIETSGHNLSIAGATVKTGQGGNWLLDPFDLTVDSAAASTIQSSLATTNVTLQTTATSASGPGTQNSSGVGDIVVNAPITWASNQTLTLDAYHGVTVNAPITSSGASAGLTIVTNDGGSGGYFTVNSPIALNPAAALTIDGHAYTLLTDATSLQNMSAVAGNYYALATDLDLTSFGLFSQIANGGVFHGALEGLGHTLNGLTINLNGPAALFGTLDGSVENLILSGGSATSTANGAPSGMLVSVSSGLINNVKSSGSVSAQQATYLGGLVGVNVGTIVNSSSSGSVTAGDSSAFIGGLVGLIASTTATVTNSFATGNVTCGNSCGYVGGLVGLSVGTISNSFASGNVTVGANAGDIGGLVGLINVGVINSSYATGAVSAGSGSQSVGGFAGENDDTIHNSYATGSVTVAGNGQSIGGLVGDNEGSINFSYSIGAVNPGAGSGTVGGFVGLEDGTTVQSYWDITTSGQSTDGSSATGLTTAQWLTQGPVAAPAFLWDFFNIWVPGYPYPVLRGLPYVVNTFTSSRTYGSTGLGMVTASSSLDQNGNNAASLVSGTLTPISALVYPASQGVGTYGLLGGSGQTVPPGYPLTYFGTVAVTPLTLVVTGISAANKVYDGNTLATILTGSAAFTNLFGSDSVTLVTSSAAGNFSDKNVGIGKTVTINGLSLSGAQAANYILPTVTTSANITPLTLTVGGTTVAANKIYDGTTLASVSGGSITGVIGNDAVTLAQTGAFSDKNAGSGKTVSYATTLTGADALNYVLPVTSGTTTANITPLTLSGSYTIGNKTYDGTTAATGSLGSPLGIVTGDQVVLSPGSYQFTDANAGAGKAANASGFALTGADAANYTLQLSQNGTATIAPAQLYYSANGGISRGFGLANPTFSGSVSGFVGSDTLASTTTGSLLFTSPATFASGIGNYAINGSGLTLTSGNYTLTQASSNASAFSIQPITISIGSVSRTAGSPNPTFTISYSGASSAYLQQLLASLQLVTNAPLNDTPGLYQITALVPAQLAADLIIQPGTLTITAGAASTLSFASFPAVLQSQPIPPPAPLPFFSGASSSNDQTVPGNAISQFQVVITPSATWTGGNSQSSASAGQPLSQASFTEIAPDGHSKNDRSTYAAGAKQP